MIFHTIHPLFLSHFTLKKTNKTFRHYHKFLIIMLKVILISNVFLLTLFFIYFFPTIFFHIFFFFFLHQHELSVPTMKGSNLVLHRTSSFQTSAEKNNNIFFLFNLLTRRLLNLYLCNKWTTNVRQQWLWLWKENKKRRKKVKKEGEKRG